MPQELLNAAIVSYRVDLPPWHSIQVPASVTVQHSGRGYVFQAQIYSREEYQRAHVPHDLVQLIRVTSSAIYHSYFHGNLLEQRRKPRGQSRPPFDVFASGYWSAIASDAGPAAEAVTPRMRDVSLPEAALAQAFITMLPYVENTLLTFNYRPHRDPTSNT